MPAGAPGARNYFAEVISLALHSLRQLVRSSSHSRRAEAARQWARRSLWAMAIGGVVIAMHRAAVEVVRARTTAGPCRVGASAVTIEVSVPGGAAVACSATSRHRPRVQRRAGGDVPAGVRANPANG